MSNHESDGTSICIHSVAVKKSFQHRGIALTLLKEYVERLRDGTDAERILLITHDELKGLYSKAGFELVGKSEVNHGSRDWYEMKIVIPRQPTQASSSIPAGVSQDALVAALSARPRGRKVAQALSGLSGIDEVTVDVEGNKANAVKLACLSERCGSTILQPRTAVLKEAPSCMVS